MLLVIALSKRSAVKFLAASSVKVLVVMRHSYRYTNWMRKYVLILLIVALAAVGWVGYHRYVQPPESKVTYVVSLGDSVAAGAGLLAVPNASDVDAACGRSSQSYPVVLSGLTKIPLKQ